MNALTQVYQDMLKAAHVSGHGNAAPENLSNDDLLDLAKDYYSVDNEEDAAALIEAALDIALDELSYDDIANASDAEITEFLQSFGIDDGEEDIAFSNFARGLVIDILDEELQAQDALEEGYNVSVNEPTRLNLENTYQTQLKRKIEEQDKSLKEQNEKSALLLSRIKDLTQMDYDYAHS